MDGTSYGVAPETSFGREARPAGRIDVLSLAREIGAGVARIYRQGDAYPGGISPNAFLGIVLRLQAKAAEEGDPFRYKMCIAVVDGFSGNVGNGRANGNGNRQTKK